MSSLIYLLPPTQSTTTSAKDGRMSHKKYISNLIVEKNLQANEMEDEASY